MRGTSVSARQRSAEIKTPTIQNADNPSLMLETARTRTAHLRKLRKVEVVEDHAEWTQKFSTHNPMFVLVRNGILTVQRNGESFTAESGDSVLLTPGAFELSVLPAMTGGAIRIEYAKFPLSLVARMVRGVAHLEGTALRPEPMTGVYVQRRMLHHVMHNVQMAAGHSSVIESVLRTLIISFHPDVFPFLREAYFQKRWAFQAMMESYVRKPIPIDCIARNYLSGRAAFFEHCALYTGLTPLNWLRKRRMELADGWLHVAKKSLSEVADALKYEDVEIPRSEYRRYFHRHPEDPGVDIGFERSLELDSPFCCMRPFWWPHPLPLGQHDPLGMSGAAFAAGYATPSIDLVVPIEEPKIHSSESIPENPHAQACAGQPAEAQHSHPQPVDSREEKAQTLIARFKNLESIPITELLPFPADLPVLLKAA